MTYPVWLPGTEHRFSEEQQVLLPNLQAISPVSSFTFCFRNYSFLFLFFFKVTVYKVMGFITAFSGIPLDYAVCHFCLQLTSLLPSCSLADSLPRLVLKQSQAIFLSQFLQELALCTCATMGTQTSLYQNITLQ